MNNKKIDVITKYFYPIAAGIETNILETYSILAKKGWDITIHTSNDTYLKKNSLSSKQKIKGLKVKRYKFKSELTGYYPDIDWDRTDVVALHNFNVSHLRILLKISWLKILGKKRFKLIITPHGGFNPEWKIFPVTIRVLKFLYQYTIGTWAANFTSDGFRAVSIWEKNELIKKGINKKKITVISNGLEDEAYMNVDKLASPKIRKIASEATPYIIQVGRIYPIKNYDTVIKALPLLPPEVQYLIVGQDEKSLDYKISLIELSKKLGVDKRIRFVGVVRGIDKYYLIKQAKVMVHMAIWESFCNVVHEAMSQGTPCVVANNTALPLLIENKRNGYLVDTYDYKKLAEKINYILKNYKSREIRTMQTIEKQFVKDNTWEQTAEKFERFISL